MSRDRTRVYVGDLGSGGSKPELEREFEKYGTLRSVWVARNPPGFAFIEFEDPLDAQDAVKDMDGRRICGVPIRCELAKNASRPAPGGRNNYRGPPPDVVSSRYRRSPPAGGYGSYRRGGGRSRSPRYRDSRSPSPRRSRSRSPRRGGSPQYQRRSPPRERGRGY